MVLTSNVRAITTTKNTFYLQMISPGVALCTPILHIRWLDECPIIIVVPGREKNTFHHEVKLDACIIFIFLTWFATSDVKLYVVRRNHTVKELSVDGFDKTLNFIRHNRLLCLRQ